MSVLQPVATSAVTKPKPKAVEAPPPGAKKRGGWFVRIAILVIVLLWTIPTIGVLVSSFRSEDLVNNTGWWTALEHPFRAGQWTIDNYRQALDNGFSTALLNSLAVTIPATVMPITIAAFAAYAFSWMNFRGRYVLFVLVVGLMVVPLQMALIPILRLYTGGAQIGGVRPRIRVNQPVRREPVRVRHRALHDIPIVPTGRARLHEL